MHTAIQAASGKAEEESTPGLYRRRRQRRRSSSGRRGRRRRSTGHPLMAAVARRRRAWALRWLGEHAVLLYAVVAFGYLFVPIGYTVAFSFNNAGKSNLVW